MERTVFNAAQLQILDLMAYVESEDTLNEIKDMLSNYFAQKAERENSQNTSGNRTRTAPRDLL